MNEYNVIVWLWDGSNYQTEVSAPSRYVAEEIANEMYDNIYAIDVWLKK